MFPVRLKVVAVSSAVGYLAYRIYKMSSSKTLTVYGKEQVIIIENLEDWELHESAILQAFAEEKVIGIDCEWNSSDNSKSPVSLLQLGTRHGFCVLVRLGKFPVWLIPHSLISLLGDESILKVGVAVAGDVNKLFTDYALEVNGYLDLRHLTENIAQLQGKNLGLKSLASELLGITLNKSSELRCSDWEASTLSDNQIKYAALDAIVAAKIFSKIISIGTQKRWFNFFQESNYDFDRYIDVPYKQKSANNEKNTKSSLVLRNQTKIEKGMSRKKPMYDNCQLVAPDGELLCNCKRGKAMWYVERGLGKLVSKDPLIIKLNFEPSRRPRYDDMFYTYQLPNQCVVCGNISNLCRKSVVPGEYRKYFPDLMKKSLSHDVVLLCVKCHKISNVKDQNLRYKLADICNAPFDSKKLLEQTDGDIMKVQSAATALLFSRNKIPELRQEELKMILKSYFRVHEVTDEILHQALSIKSVIQTKSHGYKVYEYFCKNGGLIQLERLWRQHFLDEMKPQFLPTMWSVDHNHKRLAFFVVTGEKEIDFDDNILGLTQDMLDEFKHLKK